LTEPPGTTQAAATDESDAEASRWSSPPHSTRTAAAHPQPGMRRCSKCEVIKPVDEFDWKYRKKATDNHGVEIAGGSISASGG
jgi:hypothetical protein